MDPAKVADDILFKIKQSGLDPHNQDIAYDIYIDAYQHVFAKFHEKLNEDMEPEQFKLIILMVVDSLSYAIKLAIRAGEQRNGIHE
jgi:hypothetical protein